MGLDKPWRRSTGLEALSGGSAPCLVVRLALLVLRDSRFPVELGGFEASGGLREGETIEADSVFDRFRAAPRSTPRRRRSRRGWRAVTS